jgi:hypothetical protein
MVPDPYNMAFAITAQPGIFVFVQYFDCVVKVA